MYYYPIISSIWYKSKIVVPYDTELYNEFLTSFNAITMNQPDFEQLISKNKPLEILVYETYYRYQKDLKTIISNVSKKLTSEFDILIFNNRISIWKFDQILAIFNIATRSFVSTRTFEKIPFWKFLFYNLKNRINADSYVIIIKMDKKDVGFLTYYIANNNMYLKTIAILPEYQKLGLTNQLILESHRTAVIQNLDGVYYVNILQNNNVDAFPKNNAFLVSKSYLLKYKDIIAEL